MSDHMIKYTRINNMSIMDCVLPQVWTLFAKCICINMHKLCAKVQLPKSRHVDVVAFVPSISMSTFSPAAGALQNEYKDDAMQHFENRSISQMVSQNVLEHTTWHVCKAYGLYPSIAVPTDDQNTLELQNPFS